MQKLFGLRVKKKTMDKKVDKAIVLPSCNEREFFRLWLTFLTPLHKLTPKNVEIAAELLRHRHRLSKVILDEGVLMKVLMSTETKDEIIKDCNISTQNFHVAVSTLRKAGFFVDGKINPKLIPNITDTTTSYNTMLIFTIKREEDI